MSGSSLASTDLIGVGCVSSQDWRPRWRCGCPLSVSVPGSSPRTVTLAVLEPGTSIADARNVKRRRMADGRPVAVVEAVRSVRIAGRIAGAETVEGREAVEAA